MEHITIAIRKTKLIVDECQSWVDLYEEAPYEGLLQILVLFGIEFPVSPLCHIEVRLYVTRQLKELHPASALASGKKAYDVLDQSKGPANYKQIRPILQMNFEQKCVPFEKSPKGSAGGCSMASL